MSALHCLMVDIDPIDPIDPILYQRVQATANAIDRIINTTNIGCVLYPLDVERQSILIDFGKESIDIVFDGDSVSFYTVNTCSISTVPVHRPYGYAVIASETDVEDVVFDGIAIYLRNKQ